MDTATKQTGPLPSGQPLTPDDLSARAVQVGPSLLGLVVRHQGVSVRIVEVEAYEGDIDPGSHAYRGKTARNAALFGPSGSAYIYLNYGIHRALNVVCGPDGTASGCLIRAGEVIDGLEVARQRRMSASGKVPSNRQLARGPGNLAKALGLDLHQTGQRLNTDADDAIVVIRPDGWAQPAFSTGPRVGVSGPGGDGSAFPWRFWITGDDHVSAYRASPRK